MFYQVFSRNNDVNGNPYRLIVVYNETGKIVKGCEARSSMPNYIGQLYKAGFKELLTVHLSPAEYNSIRKRMSMLEHVD